MSNRNTRGQSKGMIIAWALCFALCLLPASAMGEELSAKESFQKLQEALSYRKLKTGEMNVSKMSDSATLYWASISDMRAGVTAGLMMSEPPIMGAKYRAHAIAISYTGSGGDQEKYAQAISDIADSNLNNWGEYGDLLTLGEKFLRDVVGNSILNETGAKTLLRKIMADSKLDNYACDFLGYNKKGTPTSATVYDGRKYSLAATADGFIISSMKSLSPDTIEFARADMDTRYEEIVIEQIEIREKQIKSLKAFSSIGSGSRKKTSDKNSSNIDQQIASIEAELAEWQKLLAKFVPAK